MFFKIDVLKNFVKFTGNHLCQRLFFNKVAGLRLKQNFPVNFVKFLRTPYFIEHLCWLLLLPQPQKFLSKSLHTGKIYTNRLFTECKWFSEKSGTIFFFFFFFFCKLIEEISFLYYIDEAVPFFINLFLSIVSGSF